MPTLNAIHRYPVKGFPGEALAAINLTAGAGLPDDRRYAVTNGISNTLDGAWLTCRSFFINSVNDRLLKYANESRGDEIILASPGGMRLSWKKGDAASLAFANRKMAEFIAPLQPTGDLPMPQITERTQLPAMLSGYWDFTDSAISIMNTASLAAVAVAMGNDLDIRRLRGNLIVTDMPAWQEFSWLGKRIRIGTAELEVFRPAQRCPATSVNPQTGERDLKVPDAMNEHFGHAFCGMYAKVVKSGEIKAGDRIEVIGDAKVPLADATLPTAPDYKLWPKFTEITEIQPHPEVRAERASKDEGKLFTIKSAGPWPLPEASPGQRMRIHIGENLIGVATVGDTTGSDRTTVLHVAASHTDDPATQYLLEKVQTGSRLIVTGPYGRG